MRISVLVLVLAACGGSSSVIPDASLADAPAGADAKPDAWLADAAPDAATPSTITVDPPVIDLGTVEGLSGAVRIATLSNPGDQPIALGPATIAPPFAINSSTCGASLDAHASCVIDVGGFAGKLGARSGSVHVDTGDGALSIPVTMVVAGRISVSAIGHGTGAITSSTNVDCTHGCSVVATAPITFIASAATGTRFLGWNARGCGEQPSCTVTPSLLAQSAQAVLVAADEHALAIAASGDAPADASYVLDQQGSAIVASVPSIAVIPAGSHRIDFSAATPSTFGGLSGACATATESCTFTMSDDATVMVIASRDAKEERVAELPWTQPARVELDRTGRIVIGGTYLASLEADGTPRWAIYGLPIFRLAADDHIVTLTGSAVGGTVQRYTPDGDLEQSIAIACTTWPGQDSLAIAADGHVAAQCGAELTELTAAGTIAWHTTVPGAYGDVSFDAAGDVTTGLFDSTGTLSYQQLSPIGAPKGPPAAVHQMVSGLSSFAVTSDPDGGVVSSWADEEPTITRTGPHAFTLPVAGTGPTHALVADDGALWFVHRWFDSGDTGAILHHLAADGSAGWEADLGRVGASGPTWVSQQRAGGGRLVLGSAYGSGTVLQVWAP